MRKSVDDSISEISGFEARVLTFEAHEAVCFQGAKTIKQSISALLLRDDSSLASLYCNGVTLGSQAVIALVE